MVRALDDGMADGAEQRLKVPPNSIEAEQALIGGLMLNAQAWDKVADVISAVDFYRQDHRLIFEAINRLIEAGSPCDVVTVSEHLDNRDELQTAGGLEYLAMLANETAGAANARARFRRTRVRSCAHVGEAMHGLCRGIPLVWRGDPGDGRAPFAPEPRFAQ